ncbi:MAG TPA: hypothetical protein VGP98_11670 [Pyrinomonadaceae bacterium]|jgi:hypothetical protein|nr:hypothetical protein [Pyrinomonadaceae bacterium]
MKLTTSFTIAMLLLLAITVGPSSAQDDKFIYADFEKTENGRAVSNNGGLVQMYTAQESTPVKYKGLVNASPGAPELVVLKTAPGNHLANFEYNLVGPNDWANVTLEVQGRPMKDGKPVADDVSGYKQLSVQLGATGVDSLRVEFISHGQGINLNAGFPQLPIRLKAGLNTYVIPLKGLGQPSWADKVDPKEVLKKLTAISISAYCNQCTPQQGMVLVDNLVFQK